MSWECRHKSGDLCNRLDVECDPGRTGCVLHGRFYFPFAPEKNTKAMNDAAAAERDNQSARSGGSGQGASGGHPPRPERPPVGG